MSWESGVPYHILAIIMSWESGVQYHIPGHRVLTLVQLDAIRVALVPQLARHVTRAFSTGAPPPPSALPLPPSIPTIPSPITSFELGMSLSFYDGTGQAESVVYKGVMPNGLTHTVRRQDGTRINVHDAHLCLKMQADLTNIPQTPLDYC